MTNQTRRPAGRVARRAFLFVLASAASALAGYFHNPSPWVAGLAVVAWSLLIVAIIKATA